MRRSGPSVGTHPSKFLTHYGSMISYFRAHVNPPGEATNLNSKSDGLVPPLPSEFDAKRSGPSVEDRPFKVPDAPPRPRHPPNATQFALLEGLSPPESETNSIAPKPPRHPPNAIQFATLEGLSPPKSPPESLERVCAGFICNHAFDRSGNVIFPAAGRSPNASHGRVAHRALDPDRQRT